MSRAKAGGGARAALVIAIALALVGTVLDFSAPHAGAHALDRPGAAALAGAAGAVAAILAGYALRFMLGRRAEDSDVRDRS